MAAVSEASRKNGLTEKPSKCMWEAIFLEYLGHMVGDGKVAVLEAGYRPYKISIDQ